MNKVYFEEKLSMAIAAGLSAGLSIETEIDKILTDRKQRAMSDLLDKFSSITHFEVQLETLPATERELLDSLRYFQPIGNGYCFKYKGKVVSQQFLMEELSKFPGTIRMTACIYED